MPEFRLATLLEQWPGLTPAKRLQAFQALPPERSEEFFLELSSRQQSDLLQDLPEGIDRLWLRQLAPDDAADLIQFAPKERWPHLLGLLDETSRREVTALLAYKEDAAGGLMSPRFARLRPEMTADEAISYLRRQTTHLETIYYAYALDENQHLLGVVTFRDLFAADRHRLVRDLMRTQLVQATEEMDQEAVAKLFAAHHLLAIPVVDAEGRMKGIVTVDDIVDVVTEEASEDIQKVGGMSALDAPYLQTSFWSMVKKRGGWLCVLFVGEMFTASAMGHFEQEIARAVVLTLFVPLIISSGGNTGSQATTLVIRAMAIGEVGLRDWWNVMKREIGAGLVLGAFLAMIGYTRIMLWQSIWNLYGPHYHVVAVTVAVSLLGVILFGTLAGAMLPFLLRRLNFDPASASAPFVATLVDISGLVIYFTVAALLMRGTLL